MTSAPSSAKGTVLHRICPMCDVEVQKDVTSCPTCNTKLVEIRDEVDNVVGQIIDGRFEIRAKLGQGGMGTVYRAWQKSVGREVAIKLMDRSYSRDAMAVRRFLREARLASQLSQPNTVSVFDFGQIDDGRLFIAMELIRGRTLYEVIQADGAFSIERTARIGVQICDALEAAHGLGIVHRDLKLENVIVLDHPPGRDLLKVLDFGLAKNIRDPGSRATESGIVVGTPRYMSPEAATTGETGPASDIYSLGVMLGELATGKPLWKGDSLAELVAQKLDPKPVVDRMPPALRGVLERLLDPDPKRRPTAEQTRAQLGQATSGDASASDTVLDQPDAGATTNIRGPSSGPQATKQLTPTRLGTAPTETPLPARSAPEAAPASPSLADLDKPPTHRRWPLVVIGLGAVAAVAVAIAVASGSDGGKASPRSAVTPPIDAAVAMAPIDAPVVEVPPDAPPAAVPSSVVLTIRSIPAGAQITFRGATKRAPATFDIEHGSKPIEIQAKLAGYQVKKIRVVPDENRTETIKLLPRTTQTKPTDEVAPF